MVVDRLGRSSALKTPGAGTTRARTALSPWRRIAAEIVRRLPLHGEYDALLEADLDTAPEKRKAGGSSADAFLSDFVGGVPWAHVDIAGPAWDLNQACVGKGASGSGVRLLVEPARGFAA